MSKYKCILPVLHNGTEYAPGEPIELEDSQAESLRACGAVGAVEEKELTKAEEKARAKAEAAEAKAKADAEAAATAAAEAEAKA